MDPDGLSSSQQGDCCHQPRVADRQVMHRRLDVRVPHQLLNRADVHTALEHVSGERRPELVGVGSDARLLLKLAAPVLYRCWHATTRVLRLPGGSWRSS